MFMFSLFRPLLLLFFCLAAFNAFAAKPATLDVNPGAYYSSAQAACDASWTYTNYYAESGKWELIKANVNYNNDVLGYCTYNIKKVETGQIYSGQGGTCNGNICRISILPDCVSGSADTVTWPLGIYDTSAQYNIAPGTEISPPSAYCVSGCSANLSSSSGSCYQNDSPPVNLSSVTYCDYSYSLTGTTCNSSSNPAEPTPQPPEPDPCVADPSSCEPGGGDTGGGDTGGGDTGGGDTGGGDTGGGDTGSGTDTTVDPSPGPGTAPQEPGAGGEGTSSVASGMACNQSTVCQGDAIQCAILAQQKAQRCQDVSDSDYPAQEDAIKSLVDGPEFELEETEIAAPSLFDQHGRFLSGSTCPPPETFHLSHAGGHTLEFSYDPICRLASDLSWVIVAFATLAAALYVGRSFGGG